MVYITKNKTTMRTILLIIFLSLTYNSISCDCKTISKEFDYANSDFVFIGKVINVTEETFTVKAIEIFKGKLIDTLVVRTNNCSIYPKMDEIWLLYACKTSQGEATVSSCGWSRNMQDVFKTSMYPLPMPQKSASPNDEVLKNIYSLCAGEELHFDIMSFRNQKINEEFKVLKTNLSEVEKKVLILQRIILVSLSILTLIIAFVGYKLLVQKK